MYTRQFFPLKLFQLQYFVITDEVIFDNTYSWTRGKRLFYHVELHMNDVSTKTEVDGFIPGEAGWDEVAQVSKK